MYNQIYTAAFNKRNQKPDVVSYNYKSLSLQNNNNVRMIKLDDCYYNRPHQNVDK